MATITCATTTRSILNFWSLSRFIFKYGWYFHLLWFSCCLWVRHDTMSVYSIGSAWVWHSDMTLWSDVVNKLQEASGIVGSIENKTRYFISWLVRRFWDIDVRLIRVIWLFNWCMYIYRKQISEYKRNCSTHIYLRIWFQLITYKWTSRVMKYSWKKQIGDESKFV